MTKKQQEKENIKSKFNGLIVGRLTGLTGEDLGTFMAEFRKNTDILNSTPEQIKSKILEIKR